MGQRFALRSSSSFRLRFCMNENHDFIPMVQSDWLIPLRCVRIVIAEYDNINLNALLYRAVHRVLIDCLRFVHGEARDVSSYSAIFQFVRVHLWSSRFWHSYCCRSDRFSFRSYCCAQGPFFRAHVSLSEALLCGIVYSLRVRSNIFCVCVYLRVGALKHRRTNAKASQHHSIREGERARQRRNTM